MTYRSPAARVLLPPQQGWAVGLARDSSVCACVLLVIHSFLRAPFSVGA